MKIFEIKGCNTCDKVLIFKDRNDEGEDFARIVAWHDDQIQTEIFKGSEVMIERFIADFTEASANAFACDFNT